MKYNNIAIFCDNNEEIMMFLNYCQDIGLLWRNGEKLLEFIIGGIICLKLEINLF